MTDPNINNDNIIDPVMSDLSLEDQAQLFQLLKVEAGMTLTMRKNGAVANGIDVDIAQVTFNNMDEGTKPLVVDYKIVDGTAVFQENKLTTIRKHTNKSLSSTVQLINLTPGKGTIKATPYLNPKMAPAPVEYEFIGKPRKLRIDITVHKNGQYSDGIDNNGFIATLIDENTNKPVNDEVLNFELSSDKAYFWIGGTKISRTTDPDGKATVQVKSSANADISLTLTVSLASDPSVTQSVVVTFKARPPKLVLNITVNDQHSDGVGKNEVLATLTDYNNNPVSGAQLELKLTGNAKFTNGTTISTLPTRSDGTFNVGILSAANANISVTYTVTLVSDRSVTKSVVVNFKVKPVAKPEFKISRIKDTAVTSKTDYGNVRAVITLPAGTPAQKYTIHFKKYTNPYYPGTFRNYGITKTKSWGNTSTLDIPVTAAGGVTNVDAWIWYADGTDFTQGGFSFFQADLLDANGQVIYSDIHGAWTTFTGQAKPVTPQPEQKAPVVIQYVSHMDYGLTGSVTIRTVYQNTGNIAPNTEFFLHGSTFPSAVSGPYYFGFTGGGSIGTTPGIEYHNGLLGVSNGSGLATFTWKISTRPQQIIMNAIEPSNRRLNPNVTGKVSINM